MTSPRVAPGLLSWAAWDALRSADAVLAPAGHPALPALDEAGIGYRLAGEPEPAIATGLCMTSGCLFPSVAGQDFCRGCLDEMGSEEEQDDGQHEDTTEHASAGEGR